MSADIIRPGASKTMDSNATTSTNDAAFSDKFVENHASSESSLALALHARRADFTRPRAVRIKIGIWNVGGHKSTERDIEDWFVDKGPAKRDSLAASEQTNYANQPITKESVPCDGASDPKSQAHWFAPAEDVGIYVLGLQEVVDISSTAEAFRSYADPSITVKYKTSLVEALPPGYRLVSEQQLVGLLLLIYASPDVSEHIRSVDTINIGTGLLGYMGNKGANIARVVLGDTTRLVFINSHFSAGNSKADVDRRNWDASTILSRARFDHVAEGFESSPQTAKDKIGDEDVAFWFGDLNYRLEGIPPDDVRRLLTLHTQNRYSLEELENRNHSEGQQSVDPVNPLNLSEDDARVSDTKVSPSPGNEGWTKSSNDGSDDFPIDPSQDPTSLQATIDSLLSHDELMIQQKSRKMFHEGWREGPIAFLPTYKYDVGSTWTFDTTEKKRGPSWCDRILYRTRGSLLKYDEIVRMDKEAKSKDREMKARGVDEAVQDEEMLFEYDPEAENEEYEEYTQQSTRTPLEGVDSRDDLEEPLTFQRYQSHQNIVSSDHKPLSAEFILKYTAAVPELKAKVQKEVARELDKAENEGRPTIAVVIDNAALRDETSSSDGIDFGDLRFLQHVSRSVTVANTGTVLAQVGFANQPRDSPELDPSLPAWLQLRVEKFSSADKHEKAPSTAEIDVDQLSTSNVSHVFSLEPGETCSIYLIAEVQDLELVKVLNAGKTLQDIIILRVVNGPDHFLPLRAQWLPTALCSTIDSLVRLPEDGFRASQVKYPSNSTSEGEPINSALDTVTKSLDSSNPIRWSAPREIFRLTESAETLVERVIAEWNMTKDETTPPWADEPGWPFADEGRMLDEASGRNLEALMLEALDTNQPFNDYLPSEIPPLHRLEATVATLALVLKSLEDGVVPIQFWRPLEETLSKEFRKLSLGEQREKILQIISPSHSHSATFILILSTLSRIASETASASSNVFNAARYEYSISPRIPGRRRTIEQNPTLARRQKIDKSFALIFADVLIRSPLDVQTSRRSAHQAVKAEIMELFLNPLKE